MRGSARRASCGSGPEQPLLRMTFDALAARGCVWAQGYPRTRTRRVLTLLNAVCDDLQRALDAAHRGGPPRDPACAHAEKRLAPSRRGAGARLPRLRAVHGAPDERAPGTSGVGERCHDFLMPYMTGVRDTLEYEQGATNPYEADARSRPPPARWRGCWRRPTSSTTSGGRASRGARGSTSTSPARATSGRTSTRRGSTSAIRRGLRHHRLRGFISETNPQLVLRRAHALGAAARCSGTRVPSSAHARSRMGPPARPAASSARTAFGGGPGVDARLLRPVRGGLGGDARRVEGLRRERAPSGRPYPDRRLRSGAGRRASSATGTAAAAAGSPRSTGSSARRRRAARATGSSSAGACSTSRYDAARDDELARRGCNCSAGASVSPC
jgi:hypothetical protein